MQKDTRKVVSIPKKELDARVHEFRKTVERDRREFQVFSPRDRRKRMEK